MSASTLLTSVVTGGTNSHSTVAEEANAFSTDFVSAGVVGSIGVNAGSGGTGSFCVNADASPDMGVTIKAGQAYVTATPSGQNSQVLRVRAAADYTTYVINANASGSTKYDWIYLQIDATKANNPAADASDVASFVTSRSSSNTTDNGSPPTYGLVLAVITVANGASSITNGNIQDKRIGSSLTTATASSSTGWNALGQVPNTVAANGNRSYTLTFNSIDITGTVSAGMRLKTSRTVAAPTQCTSLNGTTQYYNKTSPAGTTFTNNFVAMAWVKLSSYAAGSIISRYNGTSGWSLEVNASGQVLLIGYNAGAANFSQILSYQSLPLNKWVHVSSQLDMSTFTATPTTSNVMIDGVDVPAAVSRGGTNPTALVQAGDLTVGAKNAGTFFPGKIAQAAVFSAKVTEATILTYISQGLAGTETSLISAYSFNNSINDLNANANNLTANGSAVATNADSPFGGQADGTISSTLDYGIIESASFSTNTTLVVQVPEGCTIPTSGGVSAVSYSTVKVPYGMPVSEDKWKVGLYILAAVASSGTVSGTIYNPGGVNINVPIGSWKGNFECTVAVATNGGGLDLSTTLSTSNSAATGATTNFSTRTLIGIASTATSILSHSRSGDITVASATPYYLLVVHNAALTALSFRGILSGGLLNEMTQVTLKPAHL